VTDLISVIGAVGRVDEVYHVADQDNVHWSKAAPGYQIDVTLKGVLNVFQAVLDYNTQGRYTKVFIPSSSTIFGDGDGPELDPQTPYAIAKAAVLHLCRYYRKEYGLQVYCGIMYGHDSPRRGPDYLLQKIARGEEIGGDLNKQVDIGHAREFMAEVVRWVQEGEPGERTFRTGNPVHITSLLNWKRDRMLDDFYFGAGTRDHLHAAPSVLHDIIRARKNK
jgi:GDPmannose 4,6-dehydratase